MPSLRSSLSLLALSAAATARSAAAGVCTADEMASTDSLFRAAASMADCTSSAVLTTTSANIFWTCADLDCAHVMRQVADELPDCDYVEGGVDQGNKKQAIADTLAACGICSNAQEDETMALYKAAAGDPRCAAEAFVVGDHVQINWTCGSSCQQVMADLAAKAPDCKMTSGSNEKKDLEETAGGCGPIADASTPSPVSADATEAPAWGSPAGSGSSGLAGSGGDTITVPTYSTSACSSADLTAMVTSVYATADSWECQSEATVTTSAYSFYASCLSVCSSALEQLAADLPDCYYETQSKNLKQDLTDQTAECWSLYRRRRLRGLEADSMFSYVRFSFVVPATTDFARNSSSSASGSNAAVGAASMASSGALGLVAAVGVAHALALL